MRKPVRAVVVGSAVAVVVGVVDGVLARLLMRWVASAAGTDPAFTLVGSASVVLLFVATAVPAGIAAVATMRPWVRRTATWVGWLPLAYAAVTIGVREMTGVLGAAPSVTVQLGVALLTLLLAIVTVWNGPLTMGLAGYLGSRRPARSGEHAAGRGGPS